MIPSRNLLIRNADPEEAISYRVEIAKLRESFTLLMKMIKKWFPNKLASSRFVHGDPSGHPKSMIEVKKLKDGWKYAKQTNEISKNDVANLGSEL